MPCPSCRAPCSVSSPDCAACGFELKQVRDALGTHLVSLDRSLIDQAQILRLAEFQSLERQLDEFERRFPQIPVLIFLGDLPPAVPPSLAGLWLLNQSVNTRRGGARSASCGIAVILEPRRGEVGLAVGYSLEGLLPAPVLQGMMMEASPHLSHREFGKALQRLVAAFDSRLRKGCTAQPRRLPSAPASPPSAPTHLGLKTVLPARRSTVATTPPEP